MIFGKKRSSAGHSLDEFVGGEDRSAAPLELGTRDWQNKLAKITNQTPGASDLALPAFTLIRGGDLFEAPKKARAPTPKTLLETYREKHLKLIPNRCAQPERDAALQGSLRVLAGNPAICRRMLLAKPIDLVLIPKGRDYREFGFPPHTNPNAAGIFWNAPRDERAMIGLREEDVATMPHLMIHEMAHAVHLLGMTAQERELIDRNLVPVYRSKRWVEEVVAIYAERAFGAKYSEAELASQDLYGKTRRELVKRAVSEANEDGRRDSLAPGPVGRTDRAVFALFMDELLRP